MKQFLSLVVCASLFVGLFVSCTDSNSYAAKSAKEKALIADFIKRNNINVLSSLPTDGTWKDNDYYLTPSGMYFHQVNGGSKGDTVTIKSKDLFWPIYIESSLDNPQQVAGNHWTVSEDPNPMSFQLDIDTLNMLAFHIAARMMKYNDAEAIIIVPSKIGFKSSAGYAIPYHYRFKIKFGQ